MIDLVRVDNRLIHGQVVEAWLPQLKVARVVVADDEAAGSPLIRAAMGLAVDDAVKVQISPLFEVDFAQLALEPIKTLVLLRDIDAMVRAQERGLVAARLNLGNIHYSAERRKVSSSVFLSPRELDQLRMLADAGIEIEARAVPSDRALEWDEIQERFEKGA